MRRTGIDLYDIVHVKVHIFPVPKMCVIPMLGKFVWTTHFGQSVEFPWISEMSSNPQLSLKDYLDISYIILCWRTQLIKNNSVTKYKLLIFYLVIQYYTGPKFWYLSQSLEYEKKKPKSLFQSRAEKSCPTYLIIQI